MSTIYERLRALNITNETNFARVGEATVWIDYQTAHAHAQGHRDHRAVVHYLLGGKWRKKEFRERGSSSKWDREACVRAAQEWVASALILEVDWVAGPFRNSWMPREVRELVMKKLKDAEEGR